MAKRLLVLFFSLLAICSMSQTVSFRQEKPFLDHLDSLHAVKEKLAYLEFLDRGSPSLKNDTLTLELARASFETNQFENALRYFLSTPLSSADTKSKREYGLSLLKTGSYREYRATYESWNDSNDSVLIIQNMTAVALLNPGNDSARLNLHRILPLHIQEKDLRKKSPMLSGLYSAVLPGSGKLYCGKKKQFINTLIANLALGIQTYEAGKKGGTGSARFIVSGLLLSVFYIGNIWGSVLEARKFHVEYYKEFENEVLDYNSVLVSQP